MDLRDQNKGMNKFYSNSMIGIRERTMKKTTVLELTVKQRRQNKYVVTNMTVLGGASRNRKNFQQEGEDIRECVNHKQVITAVCMVGVRS